MVSEDEALVEFLEDAAGGNLRGIVRYREDDYRFLSDRSDAGWSEDDPDLASFVEQFRNAELAESQRESFLNVGNHHATVRLYDDAVVVHFPQGPDNGTLVSLDPSLASDLAGFVSECLGHLYRDSPQVIENAPDW